MSVGEQQRIGFARLLYHCPIYGILDESTSSLDLENEAKCLSACHDAHITLISVAHRPSAMVGKTKLRIKSLEYQIETDDTNEMEKKSK